jgi:hypothetical protein
MFGKNKQEESSIRPEQRHRGGSMLDLRPRMLWPRWVIMAIAYFALLTSLGVIGGYSLNNASAANWNGPSAPPPQGNLPIPVWNRYDNLTKQAYSAVDIDGYVSAGSLNYDLGVGAGGQNLYYGFATYGKMNQADYLMLLETENSSVWTSRFRVNRDGDVAASGNITVGGCFGPVFIGTTTPSKFKGDLSPSADRGYYLANGKCAAAFTGSHICSTAEMLNSIKCSAAALSSATYNGTDAWIQDGPPGYTAPANDCQGWQSQTATDLGRIWRFDSTKAGKGFLTTCNQDIVFACCR